jgi:DNA-binding NarL/FixJ family response regulator
VGEAQTGREGMARYRATPADLVITNILMPEQEGLETIAVVRWEPWTFSTSRPSLGPDAHCASRLRSRSHAPRGASFCSIQAHELMTAASPLLTSRPPTLISRD